MALFFPDFQSGDVTSDVMTWEGGTGFVTATGDFNGATAIFEIADEVDPGEFSCRDHEYTFGHPTKVPFTLGACDMRVRIVNSDPDNPPRLNFSVLLAIAGGGPSLAPITFDASFLDDFEGLDASTVQYDASLVNG